VQQQAMVLRQTAGLTGDDDVVARPECAGSQARFRELLRRGAFDHPDLLLALIVGRFDPHERMGVAPEKFLQGAFDRDGAAKVRGGNRMMSQGGVAQREKDRSARRSEHEPSILHSDAPLRLL
jgi:hypothetical protein